MNLVQARTQAHNGWVRSPTRTGGMWLRVEQASWQSDKGDLGERVTAADLDASDWEPRPVLQESPEPLNEFVWVHPDSALIYRAELIDPTENLGLGWRYVHIKESEPLVKTQEKE